MASWQVEVCLAVGQEKRLACFEESIVDTFGDGVSHVVCLHASFADGRLTLCRPSETDNEKENVLLARPPCCPLHEIAMQNLQEGIVSTVASSASRSVAMAAAVLLESSDEMVLLTQRALSMRTFPGLWVVPGGHVERSETLDAAGLRELAEETGIKLSDEAVKTKKLCFWESTYPPLLSRGYPQRHHVISYIHIKCSLAQRDLHEQLALCADEVAAITWLNKDEVKKITRSMNAEAEGEFHVYERSSSGLNSTFRPFKILLAEPPSDVETTDCERLSSGSRFALEQWLLLTS